MWKCYWLLFVFCLQRSVVISLSLCEGNGYLECDETRNFSTFTCTGLTSLQTVWWQLMYDNQAYSLGSCQPFSGGTSTCIPGAQPKVFQISRTSATASSISTFSGTSLSAISDKGLLTCTSQEGNDETTCPFDYIYQASGSMCEVYFSTASTWSVVVNCIINKARSIRGRYSCQLRQNNQVSGATVLLPAVQILKTQTSPDGYVSGVCNISSFLPSDGQYTYEVTITPGNVNVSANFIGSNIIRRPSGSLTHNCPQHVTEGDDLICQGAISDLGSPAGILQWNNTMSSQLSLRRLRREQHGENYVCSLTWNKTVQQSLTYTLIMTYPPTSMSFKLKHSNNNTMTVVENTLVTMLCQCDGRPTPNLTITDVTNDNILESLQGRNVSVAELSHTITLTQCEASGEYRCEAENNVGRTFQSLKLFVKCTPRKASADANSKPPAIFEGQNASFQLIAYPTPVNVTKYFIGSNMCSCETLASNDIFIVDCSSSSQWVYKITCTVTVMKVTSYTAGLYKAVVSNELGGVALIFEALPRNTTESEKCDDLISAEFSRGQKSGLGIGLGVAAAEAGIFVILVVVFFWRRKKQTSNARGGRKNTAYSSRQDILSDNTTELNSLRSPSGHDKNEQESAYEVIKRSETGQTGAYTNVEGGVLSRKTSNKPGDVYDGLRLHDVGVRSPYASLS